MKTRRWLSRDAHLLLKVTGENDPTRAITKRAAELIDEAVLDQPPFYPEILASFRGVSEVRRKSMAGAARLVPEKGSLIIEVNQDHSAGKQNFSIDHEVAHTLLPTYAVGIVDDEVTGQFPSNSETELLCDIGASALLLDARWLRPLADSAGASLQTLFQLADLFGASLQATALRLSELNVWPCAFVFWEEGYRKSDRIPQGQGLMPGMEHFGKPGAKLRVSFPYVSSSFGYFVPKNKSVEHTSLVAQCSEAGEPTFGIEAFDLGLQIVELFCENAYVPYKSGPTVNRRVISLLLPTELHGTPPRLPSCYQLENF